MRNILELILVFISFFLITLHLSAQEYSPIQTGPRITFDYISLGEDSFNAQSSLGIDSLSLSRGKNAVDFGLGMFMQFNIKDYLFLRPEAIVHISNRELEMRELSNNIVTPLKSSLFSFTVPVHIGYRIEGVSLQLGLVWHHQLRGEGKKDSPEDIIYKYDSSHMAYSFGLGYQSKWFLFDAYFQRSLTNVEDGLQINEMDYEFNSKPIYLSVRIGFILSGRGD